MVATLLVLLVWVPLGLVAGLVGIPWTWVTGDIRPMYRAAMRVIRLGLRAGGIRVEVRGLELVPAGVSCIFLCNHVSNLDPPVILPVLPGMSSVLLKKELMGIPVLGTAMRMGRYVPVERGARPEAAAASVAAARVALEDGLHILVFPEGTRSKDGRLGKFKKGPFYLAMDTGAPLVPMVVEGTDGMLGRGGRWVRPGTAKVRVLGAIDPAGFGTREELMEAVRGAMAEALPEGMRPVG